METGVLIFILFCGQPRHIIGMGDSIFPFLNTVENIVEKKQEPFFSWFQSLVTDPNVRAIEVESATKEELRGTCKGIAT